MWQLKLREDGWIVFPRDGPFKAKIQNVLNCLDYQKLQCRTIIARERSQSNRLSLSGNYGLGQFPLHTDNASSTSPPRFIMLAAPASRPAQTLLFAPLTACDFDRSLAQRALFKVRSQAGKVYARLLSGSGAEETIRFNPDLMEPANEEAQKMQKWFTESLARASVVDWRHARLAVIDNRRVLHARSSALLGPNSYIHRLSVW